MLRPHGVVDRECRASRNIRAASQYAFAMDSSNSPPRGRQGLARWPAALLFVTVAVGLFALLCVSRRSAAADRLREARVEAEPFGLLSVPAPTAEAVASGVAFCEWTERSARLSERLQAEVGHTLDLKSASVPVPKSAPLTLSGGLLEDLLLHAEELRTQRYAVSVGSEQERSVEVFALLSLSRAFGQVALGRWGDASEVQRIDATVTLLELARGLSHGSIVHVLVASIIASETHAIYEHQWSAGAMPDAAQAARIASALDDLDLMGAMGRAHAHEIGRGQELRQLPVSDFASTSNTWKFDDLVYRWSGRVDRDAAKTLELGVLVQKRLQAKTTVERDAFDRAHDLAAEGLRATAFPIATGTLRLEKRIEPVEETAMQLKAWRAGL